ncbi:malyl-CoA lyase Mcl (plasmid) [Cupriavidus necator N-1]|uniref:Malyl-CoA lyase Mcl n=1 Tax=Cupriavidus necator (strain ATCC 43291 / DSM 13513 / CCUG 52238 / LMG 8453 / N-1) TaxID=1042878 RepID=F8GUL8_CUPNN|nr:CoA ester lyase [Cupriavidus necator]AEI82422.1 malyl-CoA lyase Mcl [Cupriavidus necator N-1]MDX6007432.1 CoA ester lyase [Cupriavidus necator]
MNITRTYLAVPAHQEKLVTSAARSSADAVFLDLEDAVPESMKATALDAAVRAINDLDWGQKVIVVRVNGIGLRQQQEVESLVRLAPRLNAVLLPKVESAEEIVAVQRQVDGTSVAIEAMIETAKGLVFCEQIAAAGGGLEALHFGVGDFGASIGAKGVEIGLSHPQYALASRAGDGYADTALDMWAYPMMRILVAAHAFGLRAIDGPCGAFRDVRLSESSALKAAAMGYDGKQVIHPLQLDCTNAAFTPTDEEYAAAQRVVAALAEAEREGRGAVQLDGKLVDYANIRMAKKVVEARGRAIA